MEDLFKQFRDNLESRPDPAFEEHDWKDMQARLERDGLNRPTIFSWWWVAVPFMLLMTGTNSFFFWQWKKAEKQFSTLEIKRDTVFHTQVIHTTDTVYRTRIVRERVVEYKTSYAQERSDAFGRTGSLGNPRKGGELNESRKKEMGNAPLAQNAGTEQFIPNTQKVGADEAISGIQNVKTGNADLASVPAKADETVEDQPTLQNTTPLPLGGIHPVEYRRKPLKLTYCDALLPAKKHRKSISDHLYAARPKGFQLGASGGFAYPFGSGLDFKSGYSIGLHTAVEFTPNLRLWVDAAYYKTLFVTDRMGDGKGVPIEAAPSNEYIFLQAEVQQPFLQYSAGMQYLFQTKHRVKPFVGLGLGTISLLPYDVIYEFKNTTLNVEWDLEKTINRQGVITNFLVLPVGLEYGFSKHWNAQLQATYRYNWKGTGVQSPNMLGIQGGLNYRF